MVRARLGKKWRNDRGIGTLQVLIMFPIVVIVINMAMQLAYDYYAKEVAMAAAEQGVQAARVTGNPADGVAAAKEYLHEHAGALLTNDTNIDTTGSTATQIRITVTGNPPMLMSPLALKAVQVSQTAIGSVEIWTHD